jgi:CheY-like chemotaxis protein
VLIVDDSKLARMAAKRSLQLIHADWVSLEASNADEALAVLNESAPQFVLLDFNMPGKDGITFAAELRERDARIVVGVISANRQTEVINRARAAGAAFIPKPLTDEALRDFLTGVQQQQVAR